MYKRRIIDEKDSEKIDRLLFYLKKMNFAYTFHASKKENEQDKTSGMSYLIHWFEPIGC